MCPLDAPTARVQKSGTPVALTIAGSDSGGGAGIQADLKTFHQWGVFGTTAITAITAQNTEGVRAVHAIPMEVIREQIRAVVDDLNPRAFKTGMLGTGETVEMLADLLEETQLPNFVLDPVLIATSGDLLSDKDVSHKIHDVLLPSVDLITPNWPEAAALSGRSITSEADARLAARDLVDAGAGAALIKGGHGDRSEVTDLFWNGTDEFLFTRERVPTRHTHGTGCSLSAAITANLANGFSLLEAVAQSTRWVHSAILEAPGLGKGHGPINHWAALPR